MSKILTGLKLSEVVKLFEEGKAEWCRPDGKFQGFSHIECWKQIFENLSLTWSVKLKEQKIEITEEQLDNAWDKIVYQDVDVVFSRYSGVYYAFKKELGFE